MGGNRVDDHTLLEAILKRPGATDSELGDALGLSRVQVNRRRNSREIQSLLQKSIQDSLQPLMLARTKAAQRICAAIDSGNEKIALQAAKLTLELTAINVSQAVDEEKQNETRKMDLQRIRETLDRIKQSRKVCEERERNFTNFGYQMTDEEMEKMQVSQNTPS